MDLVLPSRGTCLAVLAVGVTAVLSTVLLDPVDAAFTARTPATASFETGTFDGGPPRPGPGPAPTATSLPGEPVAPSDGDDGP